jgi:hypothetical protein
MTLPERHGRLVRAVEGVLEAGHDIDESTRRALEILTARRAEDAVIESALLQLQTHERIAAVHFAAVAKALEAERIELANLPPCADSVALLSRAAGVQLGHPFDPKRRHFLGGHVGFIERSEWETLKATSPHRALDGVFAASPPFADLSDIWRRARNWRGIAITANSPSALGELTANLDRLAASVPNELIATWYRNADGHLQQSLRAAAQRIASRSDPEHFRPRWSPPWEAATPAEQAAE